MATAMTRCGVVVAGIVVGDRPGNAQARCVTDNTGCRRANSAGYGVSHRSAIRQVGSSAQDVMLSTEPEAAPQLVPDGDPATTAQVQVTPVILVGTLSVIPTPVAVILLGP